MPFRRLQYASFTERNQKETFLLQQPLTLRSTILRCRRLSAVSWWRCCGCKRRWCEFSQGQDRLCQGRAEWYLPPAGGLVHLCGCGAPVFVPVLQDFAGLGQTLDIDPLQIWKHVTIKQPCTVLSQGQCQGQRLVAANLWRKRSRRRRRTPGATPVSWTWGRATAAAGRTPVRCRFQRTPPTVWTGSRLLLPSHWWDLKKRIDTQISSLAFLNGAFCSLYHSNNYRCAVELVSWNGIQEETSIDLNFMTEWQYLWRFSSCWYRSDCRWWRTMGKQPEN